MSGLATRLNERLTGDGAMRGVGLLARTAAIALGLSISAWQGNLYAAWWSALALGLLAALVVLPLGDDGRSIWPSLVEMGFAGAILSFGKPIDTAFFPYLLTAATYWGLRGGLPAGLSGVGVAALTLLAPQALIGESIDSSSSAIMAQWLLLSALGAAAGAWSRARQTNWQASRTQYSEAYRLLLELREVARRLPAGLDEATAGATVLLRAGYVAPSQVSAVMRIDGDGPPQQVAVAGDANQHWYPEASSYLMQRVTEQGTSAQSMAWLERDSADRPERAYRAVAPITLGGTRIGLILLQREEPWDDSELSALQAVADDCALMLDTAFVFSDIRTLATTEERRRLAREIHDGIAQELAGLAYAVDDVKSRTPEDLLPDLQAIRDELTRLVSELRLSIFELRSNLEPGSGLGASMSDYVRQVGTRSGLTVHLELDEESTRFPADVEAEIMRITQEAVTNARRHARAKNLWVTLRSAPPQALVRVSDDGVGMAPRNSAGYGLGIMRERATRIGGRIASRARPGGGTVVELIVGETAPSTALSGDTTTA